MTVSQILTKIAEHKGTVKPLHNEQTGQTGVRVTVVAYGREQHFDSWFPTEVLNRSNGPIVLALRQAAELLGDAKGACQCGVEVRERVGHG